MECLSHPDRRRVAQPSGVELLNRKPLFRWSNAAFWPPMFRSFHDRNLHGGHGPDHKRGPGRDYGCPEHDRDEYLDISPDHFGGRVDTALLVRGRHRAPRGWTGWCIRQWTVRDLAWRRR